MNTMACPDLTLSLSGKSIALRLANDGYDVCINDISANKQGAEEVAHEITQLGRKSTVAIGDVSVMSEVESVVQQSVNELGPLNTMSAFFPRHHPQKKEYLTNPQQGRQRRHRPSKSPPRPHACRFRAHVPYQRLRRAQLPLHCGQAVR